MKSIKGLTIRHLGLFRLLLGAVIVFDLVIKKNSSITFFYTDEGVLPAGLLSQITETYQCSLFYYLHSTTLIYLFWFLTIAAAILYTIGYRTKLVSIVLYILLFSIHERNAVFLSGAHQIERTLLFWSIFLPLNGSFTLFPVKYDKHEVRTVAAWGILIQICLIYFVNAWVKTGDTWKEGTAVAYAVMIPMHRGMFADYILSNPLLYTLLTYGTVIFEYLIPFLIFVPYRNELLRFFAAILIFSFHWLLLPFLVVEDFALFAIPVIALLIPENLIERIESNLTRNETGIKILSKEKEFFISKSNKNLSLLLNIFLSGCILFSIWISFNDYNKLSLSTKKIIAETCNCFGLSQQWRMFAPDPTIINGYAILAGEKEGKNYSLVSGKEFFLNNIQNSPLSYKELKSEYTYLDQYLPKFISASPSIGNVMAERWLQLAYKDYKKKNGNIKFEKLIIYRVFLKSESPGKYSLPQIVKLYEIKL
jgi:hypothetical protein